jgi:hypothetical protein
VLQKAFALEYLDGDGVTSGRLGRASAMQLAHRRTGRTDYAGPADEGPPKSSKLPLQGQLQSSGRLRKILHSSERNVRLLRLY